MKRRLLLFSFVCFLLSYYSFASPSYYPDEYVHKFENGVLKNNALKVALRDILEKKHLIRPNQSDKLVDLCSETDTCRWRRVLDYKTARKYLFGKLHLDKNQDGEYTVKDVYCNYDFTDDDFKTASLGPMKIPDSNILNCEHSWPRSKFNSQISNEKQKTDLHHLFPTDTVSNSVRSSHIFAEVNGHVVSSSCVASHIGDAIRLITDNTAFEPPDEHKGNVARALFYFSTLYKLEIEKMEERYLRVWHQLDPVDSAEIKRNHSIMNIQNNRNPFIDFPELVDLIENF